jgi:hypothetical protein
MSKHVTVVGIARLGLAALGVVLAAMIYFGSRWMLGFPDVIEDRMAVSVLTTMSDAAVVFIAIGCLLSLIAGLGILAHQGWARYLTMILSIFDLFNIPVGTALALYTLWVLMQDDVVSAFGGPLPTSV